jgi:hypothetical protein
MNSAFFYVDDKKHLITDTEMTEKQEKAMFTSPLRAVPDSGILSLYLVFGPTELEHWVNIDGGFWSLAI